MLAVDVDAVGVGFTYKFFIMSLYTFNERLHMTGFCVEQED